MWIKNIFKKDSNKASKKQQQEQDLLKSKFQQQDLTDSSSPLIDNTPDTRYNNLQTIPHTSQLGIPLTQLHTTEAVLIANKQPYASQKKLYQAKSIHQQNFYGLNLLLMTDRQLILSPNLFSLGKKVSVTDYLIISYGMIQKCQYITNKKQPSKCIISLKDQRVIIITSVMGDYIKKIEEIIKKFGFVNGINKFYAFRYGKQNQELVKYKMGWNIYNIQRQFLRQGIQIAPLNQQSTENYLYKYIDNRNGQISSTYPQIFVVPERISLNQIIKCSKFRTKQRLPVLTYALEYSNGKFSTLFRCSQNKVGMMGARCKQDQFMMECIGDPDNQSKQSKNCKIYDARGYYAALGNMFAGKGFQKQQNYKNCQITWLDIPNIHAVRDSYNMLKSTDHQKIQFIQTVGNSGWYDFLFLIIAGSKSIARDLLRGYNVVVHCSDGWDRTSQLCSLSQILLDPYFRTIKGLAILIQKDWRRFGHKFRQRTGQYHPNNYHPYQKSQVFIQFLDCIFQLMAQFPLSFEYNDKLLSFLSQAVNQCTYGTFLANSYQQGKNIKIQQNTVSVWHYVFQNKTLFQNPFYVKQISQVQAWLQVSSEVKHLKVWKNHFLGQIFGKQMQHEVMTQQTFINSSIKDQYYKNQELLKKLRKQYESLNSSAQ